MNQDLLCNWLGLPKASWPPDPWTLLGVARDEHDLAVVETRVHDRMTKLRTYQLSYPEEATEGMNRLAEAFITLTETCGKARNGSAPAPVQAKPAEVPPVKSAAKTGTDWRSEPPPVREEASDTPEAIAEEGTARDEVMVSKPFAAPAKPIRRVIDPILTRELAEESEEATSNLATLEAVIERVDRTRALLHSWDRLGKYLQSTAKKFTTKESENFAARLDKVAQAMQTYPAFLGQPGKPGYRVAVQARLKASLAMVRGLTAEQREELVFDWQAGRQVLLAHRTYLLRLFKSMRHRTALGLFWHALRARVNDHPLLTLVAVVIVLAIIGGVGWALR